MGEGLHPPPFFLYQMYKKYRKPLLYFFDVYNQHSHIFEQ